MPNLMLRSLRPDDLDRVVEIESGLTGRSRRVFQENRLVNAANLPESFITSAVMDGDKLVGYGYSRVLHGEFGVKSLVGVLVDLGVDAAYHGKGVGRMLLSGIVERMARKGIRSLQTQADWNNLRLVKFFSSNGFALAPGQVIERDTSPLPDRVPEVAPVKMDGKWRIQSDPGGNWSDKSPGSLSLVRSLREDDLAAVVRVDTELTGLNRFAYYVGNFREMLQGTGIRVSMVAEIDRQVNGFVMARVDYGEYGTVEKAAVIDAIGVHPAHAGSGMGHALLAQLIANLATLQVETVRTKVGHDDFGLRAFLQECGFKGAQRLLLNKEIG